jgi:hypothetical protein
MENFFGIENASKMPEYDFIIDPNLNEAYQSLKAMPMELQREQSVLGVEQQELELEGMKEQQEMMEMQAQMGGQQPMAAPGEEAPPAEAEPTEAKKSLREEFFERDKLQKSMGFYFKSWIDAHNE